MNPTPHYPTQILILCSLTLLLAGAAGCSDDDNPPKPDARVTDAAADAGADTGPTPDTGPLPDTGPPSSFCGVLKDVAGAPLASADVIVCNDTECHTDTSGSTGTFCVEVNVPTDYMFHATEQKLGSKHYSDVTFPLVLTAAEAAAGTKKDLGTVVVPELGAAVTLDEKIAKTLDLGGGIKLVVPANVAVKPPLASTIEVAAAAVAVADIHPQLLASGTGAPVAALASVPLELTFTSPIAFELPAPAGLTDGTALTIFRSNEKTGKLESHGEATVSGSTIKEVGGKGIAALGWLLFYKK